MAKEIPDPQFSGKNLDEMAMFFESGGYAVSEWTPHRDGKGKPEAIMITFDMAGRFDGVTFGIRIKSRAEADRLITILRTYRDSVWPA